MEFLAANWSQLIEFINLVGLGVIGLILKKRVK